MVNKYLVSGLLVLAVMPALAKPLLTIYTYDSFAADWGPGPAVKKAFEKECDCELTFVALADGVSLLNRVRIEGKNSAADVVLGLDNNLLHLAHQTGLFAESQLDPQMLTIPGGWQDKTFIPYDYGYFAFIYRKDPSDRKDPQQRKGQASRTTQPPSSLKELISGDHPWKIIYQDPRTSTPGLGLLLWVQKVYGDKAPEAWQQLAKKTLTVTKGWSEAYGLFLKGEGDMVLSYTTSPAYHLIEEKNEKYAAANFREGHYMQVEVAAKLKASKQPELAEHFMQFMITPAFQQTIPTGNWMYPVINTPLPAGFDQMIVPQTALQYSAETIAQQRNNWIRIWQAAVSR